MDKQEYYVRLDEEIICDDGQMMLNAGISQGITSDPYTILCNMPDIAVKHQAFGENVRNSGGIKMENVEIHNSKVTRGRLTCEGYNDVLFTIMPIVQILLHSVTLLVEIPCLQRAIALAAMWRLKCCACQDLHVGTM